MVRYLIVIVFFFAPIATAAELTFSELQKISNPPLNHEGTFLQKKYLGTLDIELKSTGVFSYQRDEWLRWETLKPLQNELLVTSESIVNRQGNQEIMRLEKSANSATSALHDILFSVLTSDWEKLANYFEISGVIEAEGWSVALQPLENKMVLFVDRVEIRGGAFVREIILYESSGDRTTIQFDNLSK
ncbi:MAG: outer membrane lipoprotein carrier protein LolA [Motiliproteus sp.]